jgi:hypothetical protein
LTSNSATKVSQTAPFRNIVSDGSEIEPAT